MSSGTDPGAVEVGGTAAPVSTDEVSVGQATVGVADGEPKGEGEADGTTTAGADGLGVGAGSVSRPPPPSATTSPAISSPAAASPTHADRRITGIAGPQRRTWRVRPASAITLASRVASAWPGARREIGRAHV